MRLVGADTIVTIQVYNDMTEEYDTKKMTIADAIDEWSDEGCPPIIDAELIRHGHWIVDEDGNITCSECGHHGVGDNYCERCGAKMDERIYQNETM